MAYPTFVKGTEFINLSCRSLAWQFIYKVYNLLGFKEAARTVRILVLGHN